MSKNNSQIYWAFVCRRTSRNDRDNQNLIQRHGRQTRLPGHQPCQEQSLTMEKRTENRIRKPRPEPKRTITEQERTIILSVLISARFCNLAPRQVYATLLDEGIYHWSWRSMYRILADHDQVRERRRQRRHPHYEKPELLARSQNELWTWDITKLKGPVPWHYYYLYVIIDVFSRYVVGFMVAERESAELAIELIEIRCQRQHILPEELTLRSDRGAAMTSKSVKLFLSHLGVKKSHSRPHVSNDNPFSEAQIKTLKYHPAFPDRFGSIQDARALCAYLR